MNILDLLKGLQIKEKYGPLDREITGIAYDSRLVEKDYLFTAVKGFIVDGHNFIRDALSRGATVVVAEHPVVAKDSMPPGIGQETTYVGVPDSRKALALISSAFYGHPSKHLSLIGITGTNGKTTTSYITKSIIDAGGRGAGLLGTICNMTGDRTATAVNTTPESLDLQRYLNEMVQNKIEHAVLEVSSHALALNRVDGSSFKVAAFTNFTQDHLDFHGTMDEYFSAKSKLFGYLDADGTAVLNNDDRAIRPLAGTLDCHVVTCGIEEGAMIRAENIEELRAEGRGQRGPVPFDLTFDVQTPESRFSIHSKLIGRFNVYNILTSIGIAYALGIDDEVIQRGVSDALPVEGRFENIDEGQDFLCIVDYAHTEDALRKLLEEARHITRGRVITVFGCGGDRDKTKRPLMGAAASELSDLVIVTSDNPRMEDPLLIMKDIVSGMKKNYTEVPDREEAIKEAVSMAREGDTLLIAGKGHEDYQDIEGVRHHFKDKEILIREIKERLALSG